jgi:DNA-binding response OmpR family regulator
MGADDYVIRPYSYRELVARTQRLIDRPPTQRQDVVTFGDLKFNKSNQEFSTVTGQLIPLKRREFLILKSLFEQYGRSISRAQLAVRLSTSSRDASEDAIDVHICKLRKLLKLFSALKISTVYGRGYKLNM